MSDIRECTEQLGESDSVGALVGSHGGWWRGRKDGWSSIAICGKVG